MTQVTIGGRRVTVSPSNAIGKGGEADIYNIGGGLALKLFKPPDHPDYEGLPREQRGAEERIRAHQQKLRLFPKNLPPNVVTPIDFALNRKLEIVGYTMRFLSGAELLMRYSERRFRESGVGSDTILEIFKNLHGTVLGIHRSNVVIGDFNDLNVMVLGNECYLIDADSFQFDQFMCRVFTARFADPTLCDRALTSLMLVKPHNPMSDWYAFSAMLFQCLLYVDPYGGVYRPKNQIRRIPNGARPLKRITVFHSEVIYPKPAIPYRVLPDDILDRFHRIFEKDERGIFPIALIENMRWTKCGGCGIEHARDLCPECQKVAPGAIRQTIVKRGKVTATRIFRTNGRILYASVQNGNLKWLYHDVDGFKRENSSLVITGNLDPQIRFRISDKKTLLGKNGSLAVLEAGMDPKQIMVESFQNLPIFDANADHLYWAAEGQLKKSGALGDEYVGDVLSNQTLFWVGSKFGFGFYRAGNMNVAFVFDAEHRGINDNVKITRLRGQLVDSTCVFGDSRAWFFVATRESGKTINHCFVIARTGEVEAVADAEDGDGSWLGTIRGKATTGSMLFAPTDEGIIRLQIENSQIKEAARFPDTEPFVDSGSQLFVTKSGIYVVDRNEITQLTIG
ncbi:MAG: hypothetical protein AAB594_02630 [Patescibacteria group bacterium]